MHSDFPEKPMLPLGDKMGYYMQNPLMASVFNGFVPTGIKPIMPFRNVDIQPSNACPRNYIIFDQTNNRSQIMFHPDISSKLFYPGFGVETPDNVVQKDINDDRKISSPLEEEDSDDIDALLSTEHEENEECDDDEVVSTARTDAIYECSSPDSCSNYESVSKKRRSLLGESRGNEKKHRRMRKMVKALRGIVPGANRMSTVAVLDETVRYLKSIRVEVQKLGVGNFKG
ncbi:hypothetical protein DH2020_009113 [Rehmannia glutinosa]|uniref:BHLH domain-containing protein n=1 Tax=Rehmannia glutinosa TaxID=99300 RepID=A0ABR0X5Y1_REHGL